jgi:DNA topoisomerase VI subunit B
MSAQIKRETFKTSRLLDFFSAKELTAQIGHPNFSWPLVALKELIDNALDACEDSGIAPEIEIEIDDQRITVTDNGPGLPAETVRGVLDFSVRVSSREAYVAPDRGAQGNALKTLVAMPFVLDGECGRISIVANGLHHEIITKVDRIKQEPVISHNEIPAIVKKGTSVTVHWPDSASSLLHEASERILQIGGSFAFLNPHMTLSVRLFGEDHQWSAVDPKWSKWLPSNPTSPHWYKVEHLGRLIAAYIAHDTGKTVREFISEFNGLSASSKQKAVLESTNLARAPLASLVQGDALDTEKITKLLAAMKSNTRPLKPTTLGVIGKDNIKMRFESFGCEMKTFKVREVPRGD